MIDAKKIKNFWDSRADVFGKVAFESIANLEQDPNNLEVKIRLETNKVLAWLPDLQHKTILDLGAGVGQWALRFSLLGASNITAVEYSLGLVEIGRKEAARRAIQNIEFVVSAAEDFKSDLQYDVIFISGLFVYLTDQQAVRLLSNLSNCTKKSSSVLLRDGVGRFVRHEINDRYSDHLQSHYSATYRTAEQYQKMFEEAGFQCLRDEDMFPEGHSLNKYPETRLRLFSFGRT